MKTWAARIADARARGTFTEEDKELAIDWGTCAVGEVHARIPEAHRAFRWGFVLLGARFYSAVKKNRFAHASYLRAAIERRALDLALRRPARKPATPPSVGRMATRPTLKAKQPTFADAD